MGTDREGLHGKCFAIFLSWNQWLGSDGPQNWRHASPIVILSPSESAIPWVLLRIRTCPVIVPATVRSILRLASASSPIIRAKSCRISLCGAIRGLTNHEPNKLRAYMFADRKSQSPESAPSGVKQDIFVTFMTCSRYSRGSLQQKKLLNERDREREIKKNVLTKV